MKRNSSNYSLIEPQLLHCAPACSYKFLTFVAQPNPTLKAPSIGGTFGVRWTSAMELFCGNSQCVKVVGYFLRRNPSWMFGRILNAALSNKLLYREQGLRRSFPPLGLPKGILNSPYLLILLIYTKHKNNKMKF